MATRNLLAINKLDDFKDWLIGGGWTIEPAKNRFEALRASKDSKKLIVFKKLEAKQHLSVRDSDCWIVRAYLKDRRKAAKSNEL